MKHSFFLILILLTFSSHAENKYALIVANYDYDHYDKGWAHLSSANDVPLIKKALLAQGFQEKNIAVVRNVTRKGFENAFKRYLIDRVQRGDIAYFHYSGHGQQIADDNGDEADGYDETLVAIDAPYSDEYEKGYDGSKHIRDDELGKYLDTLRERLTTSGHVLVTLDACQSGTGTRGGTEPTHVRGTFRKWEFSNAVKNLRPNDQDNWDADRNSEKKADLFFISASSQYELDYEMPDYNCGSLSYAFSYAFSKLKARKGQSYQQLFEEIKQTMGKYPSVHNHPQYEGNSKKEILGNNLIGAQNYFVITDLLPSSTTSVTIDGGEIGNLYPGTKVALYKNNVINEKDMVPANFIATGEVISADISSAVLRISTTVNKNTIKNAHVFVTDLSYKGISTKVYFRDDMLCKTIKKIIDSSHGKLNSIIPSTKDYELVVAKSNIQKEGIEPLYDIVDLYGNLIERAADYEKMIYRIIEYGRANLLMQIGKGHTEKIHFSLLQTSNCNKEFTKCDYASFPGAQIKNNVYSLTDSEVINFKLTYDSIENGKAIHFLLFEISPQYEISRVWPSPSKQYQDCQLSTGNSLTPNSNNNWLVFRAPLSTGPSRFNFRLLVSEDDFGEQKIKDLYFPDGIITEQIKYNPERGAKGGLTSDTNKIDETKFYKTAGAIDITYEIPDNRVVKH